jgi:hypothetical protein
MAKRGRKPLPKTPEAWQVSVDLADGALALDACRQYGLVTGGPVIHAGRCERMLREGAKRGYKPSPNAWEMFVGMWQEHCDDARKAQDDAAGGPVARLARPSGDRADPERAGNEDLPERGLLR